MTAAITIAQELLACLEARLTVSPYPILPEHIMLRAGAEVTPLLGTADDECCRGLGWVRVQGVTGVKQLGDSDNVACFAQERTLTFELGVARCAPSSDISSVPTEDQWTDAALRQDSDMGDMEAAICCAFRVEPENPLVEEVSVGGYAPFGVDGNCIGGTMLVNVRMSACC